MADTKDSLRRALQSLYVLKNPIILEQIEKGGYKAASFIVGDGDVKFFLKKYHSKRSPERLLEIHRVKRFFNEHGVTTIPPLVNSKGSTLFEIDGELFAIFPYISDKQYYALPNDKAVASAGENLAKLHLAGTDNLSLVRNKIREPWDKEKFLKKASKMLELAEKGTGSFDITAREMLTFKIELARSSNVFYEDLGLTNDCILHGDYHTHNLFFGEDDNVSYTFDFERTMVGPRATDVAYGLFMICFDFNTDIKNDVSQVHFDRARSFIQAYNKIFSINTEEFLNSLRWFFWSQIVYIEWPFSAHYLDGDTRADILLPKRLNRLKYFAENLDAILETLERFLSEDLSRH